MISKRLVMMLLVAAVAPAALAQSSPSWGRFSLFGQTARQHSGSSSTDYREVIGTLTLRSGGDESTGFQYAFDGRFSTYPSGERDNRSSLYDAWVGFRSTGGFGLRLGQMWLNEFGGLGSLGGVAIEWRQEHPTSLGRFRAGVFGGLEPEYFDVGYAPDVKKAGAYVAIDGDRGRRHSLGYVRVQNQGLTERSVISLSNFIPAGGTKFFLYQMAEYDLQGPAGTGTGGLNYLFVNARWAPTRVIELQTSYHHGRSIDARTITNDILNGRPVDPHALEGLLFESAGARVTVIPLRDLRVWAGLSRERNNRGEATARRYNAGLSTNNLFGIGLDITATGSRIDRAEAGSYNSWYLSLGKTLGRRIYLTADVSTALSVFRYVRSDNVVIESRPRTRRYSLSSLVNISRVVSINLSGERLDYEDTSEDRYLTGLSVRF